MTAVEKRLLTAAARGAPGSRDPAQYAAVSLTCQDALDAASEITTLRAELDKAQERAEELLQEVGHEMDRTATVAADRAKERGITAVSCPVTTSLRRPQAKR